MQISAKSRGGVYLRGGGYFGMDGILNYCNCHSYAAPHKPISSFWTDLRGLSLRSIL